MYIETQSDKRYQYNIVARLGPSTCLQRWCLHDNVPVVVAVCIKNLHDAQTCEYNCTIRVCKREVQENLKKKFIFFLTCTSQFITRSSCMSCWLRINWQFSPIITKYQIILMEYSVSRLIKCEWHTDGVEHSTFTSLSIHLAHATLKTGH